MDINEWTAEKCGIRVVPKGETAPFWTDDIEPVELVNSEWTMNDARCKEIVREHFKMDTSFDGEKWYAWIDDNESELANGKGKSIKEAEIACLEAIMKAEIDNG